MKPIYRKILIGCCGTGIVVGGALAYTRAWGGSSSGAAEKVPELSAADFNALQSQQQLKEALRSSHLPWTFHKRAQSDPGVDPLSPVAATSAKDMKLVFYRLLGCPYCAKVEAVLRFYDIPYEEVQIDPITGRGLPDPRYRLAPQLYFTPLATATPAKDSGADAAREGVFLVDSGSIAAGLAGPLGYGRQLRDPRIAATRDWITTRFHSASFVVTNSTIRNAYIAYGYLTPKEYQNILYRIAGSIALYGLANYKIKPRVLAQPHPLEDSYRQVCAARAGPSGEAAKVESQSPEAWLRDELDVFLSRVGDKAAFHGGAAPDIADVEMYGVTRVVSMHPRLGQIVKEGRFGQWERAMEEAIAKQRDGRP